MDLSTLISEIERLHIEGHSVSIKVTNKSGHSVLELKTPPTLIPDYTGTQQQPYINGYTCAACGGWAISGQSHICPGMRCP
ncbi:MAG: hypothetical protein ACYTEW_20885 [Planctomycetota bacterium]